MNFSNTTYDRLKYLTLIGLPALAAFYLGLSDTWGLPEPEKVGTSIGLFAALLGTLLQISNSKYKNENVQQPLGELKFTGSDPDSGIPDIKLTVFPEVAADPGAVLNKGEVKLKVTAADNFVPKKLEAPEEEIEEH